MMTQMIMYPITAACQQVQPSLLSRSVPGFRVRASVHESPGPWRHGVRVWQSGNATCKENYMLSSTAEHGTKGFTSVVISSRKESIPAAWMKVRTTHHLLRARPAMSLGQHWAGLGRRAHMVQHL
eukprot:3183054-Rhodomonas_salina.6